MAVTSDTPPRFTYVSVGTGFIVHDRFDLGVCFKIEPWDGGRIPHEYMDEILARLNRLPDSVE